MTVSVPAASHRAALPPAPRPTERFRADAAGRLLAEETAAAGLLVTVTRGCGRVEVRVSGPEASLRLFFDPWDLGPADVRRVVPAAIARYRSALLGKEATRGGAPGRRGTG